MGTTGGAGNRNLSPERWHLTLFGNIALARTDGEPVQLPGRRERILLAYLALQPGKPENRRKLAGMLWGDTADETLLDNLRTCVWALRKSLGDADHKLIVSKGDSIVLSPGMVRVDVLEFLSLARQSDRKSLENAAALYNVELLRGSKIDSTEFDDWLAEEETHLSGVAVDIHLRLAAHLVDAGEKEGAIRYLLGLLRLDPYHERAVRCLMSLYVETGRRGIAFESYRALVSRLDADLSAEPELETRQLFAEISQGNYSVRETGTADKGAGPAPRPEVIAELGSLPATERPDKNNRRPIVFALAAVLALAALVAFFLNNTPTLGPESEIAALPFPSYPIPERPSIAVLSFENLSGDPAHDAFADALTNDITTGLSIISRMFVIDRSSTLTFVERPAPIQEIANTLGVRYILEGGVQRSEGRVRVSPRLIDTETGQQIWADRFDREVQDTFIMQDEITRAVITALQVELTEGEQRRHQLINGTRNLEAWLTASQAIHFVRQLTNEDNRRARELYQRAVDLDPDYAGALAGLGWTYVFAARFGWSDDPARDFDIAQELGARAISLQPSYSRIHALNSMLQLTAGEHEAAIRSGERAVELEPNGSENIAMLGLTLTYAGEAGQAENLILRAMRLSPYYPDWYRYALGRALRMGGKFSEAEEILTSFESAGALRVMTLTELAATYAALGRTTDARETAEEIAAQYPAFSTMRWVSLPPFADPVFAEAEVALLRAAGLPD